MALNALARRDDDDGEMDRATAANGDMDSREPPAILASATEARRMRNTIKLGTDPFTSCQRPDQQPDEVFRLSISSRIHFSHTP